MRNDFAVSQALVDGSLPPRPHVPELTDELWELMFKCWRSNPASRPCMREVKEVLKRLDRMSRGSSLRFQSEAEYHDFTSHASIRQTPASPQSALSVPSDTSQRGSPRDLRRPRSGGTMDSASSALDASVLTAHAVPLSSYSPELRPSPKLATYYPLTPPPSGPPPRRPSTAPAGSPSPIPPPSSMRRYYGNSWTPGEALSSTLTTHAEGSDQSRLSRESSEPSILLLPDAILHRTTPEVDEPEELDEAAEFNPHEMREVGRLQVNTGLTTQERTVNQLPTPTSPDKRGVVRRAASEQSSQGSERVEQPPTLKGKSKSFMGISFRKGGGQNQKEHGKEPEREQEKGKGKEVNGGRRPSIVSNRESVFTMPLAEVLIIISSRSTSSCFRGATIAELELCWHRGACRLAWKTSDLPLHTHLRHKVVSRFSSHMPDDV
jgi:hypothetical protein